MDLDRRAVSFGLAALPLAACSAEPRPAAAQPKEPRPLLTRAIPSTGEQIPVVGLGTWQAFDIVRLRAIEQRRFLVRVSTAGPSAVVDPLGRILAMTEPFTQAWISVSIEPRGSRTLYQRFGDAFGLACLTVALGAALVALLPGSTRPPPASDSSSESA